MIIHGAGGAVGSTAVQLARRAGAEVIGTGRSHSRSLVLELGAPILTSGTNCTRGIPPVGGEERGWKR